MDVLLVTAFIATSIAVIVVPGPNVLIIVSASISHGAKQGLWTVLGTSSAMSIQLMIAAVSTGWFVEFTRNGFEMLKWIGVAYLFYLGISHLTQLYHYNNTRNELKSSSSFAGGFMVSLTNPKTIIFFSAFLPQFVTPSSPYSYQITILSLLFLILATFFDCLYAVLAGNVSAMIQSDRAHKIRHGISGLLFLSLALWLMVLRET